MNVMILAAGRGTRLGQLGLSHPKILLEIGNEPLLMHHLRYLERERVGRVVINAHHHANDIKHFVQSYDGALELVVVEEPELLGTAGGVRNALEYLGSEPFAVLYGDVIIREPLDQLADMHRSNEAIATLTVYGAESTTGKGVVEFDEHGRILRFAEKQPGRSGPGYVNAGLYLLDPDLVAALPHGEPLDFGHDVLPAAVDRGEAVFAYRLEAPVLDVGTREDLQLARRLAATAA